IPSPAFAEVLVERMIGQRLKRIGAPVLRILGRRFRPRFFLALAGINGGGRSGSHRRIRLGRSDLAHSGLAQGRDKRRVAINNPAVYPNCLACLAGMTPDDFWRRITELDPLRFHISESRRSVLSR